MVLRTSCNINIEATDPDLGQHTEDILMGLPGMKQEEFKHLREKDMV